MKIYIKKLVTYKYSELSTSAQSTALKMEGRAVAREEFEDLYQPLLAAASKEFEPSATYTYAEVLCALVHIEHKRVRVCNITNELATETYGEYTPHTLRSLFTSIDQRIHGDKIVHQLAEWIGEWRTATESDPLFFFTSDFLIERLSSPGMELTEDGAPIDPREQGYQKI